MFAACRAWYIVIFDEVHHLFLRPSVYRALKFNTVLLAEIFDDLICTETFVTFLTVHQRVREASQMSGCNPCLRIHQDRTVNTYIVWGFLNKFLPPCTFYVIL